MQARNIVLSGRLGLLFIALCIAGCQRADTPQENPEDEARRFATSAVGQILPAPDASSVRAKKAWQPDANTWCVEGDVTGPDEAGNQVTQSFFCSLRQAHADRLEIVRIDLDGQKIIDYSEPLPELTTVPDLPLQVDRSERGSSK